MQLDACDPSSRQARSRLVDSRPLTGGGIEKITLGAGPKGVGCGVQGAVMDVGHVVVTVKCAALDELVGPAALRGPLGRENADVIGRKSRATYAGDKLRNALFGCRLDLPVPSGFLGRDIEGHGVQAIAVKDDLRAYFCDSRKLVGNRRNQGLTNALGGQLQAGRKS